MKPITVLVVDDHAVVRRGLRSFLQSEQDIQVVAEAASGAEAVELAKELQPAVVLMDLVMPGMDGIETTRRVLQASPNSYVLVLTSFGQDDKVFPAIKAGARGYLLKDVPAEELGRAIRSVAQGDFLLYSDIADSVLQEFRTGRSPVQPVDDLTPREMEVLTLIAQGYTNREISEALCITVRTVKTHVSNILGKLRAGDRTQAAVYAVQHGLVPPP